MTVESRHGERRPDGVEAVAAELQPLAVRAAHDQRDAAVLVRLAGLAGSARSQNPQACSTT